MKITVKIISSFIGWVEILIGLSALLGCSFVQFTNIPGASRKPDNVFIFVVFTAVVSVVLGLGLLKRREWARTLLTFFSGYVILTKILIYSGLMVFEGALVTFIPAWSRDLISMGYHAFLVIFLTLTGRSS